MKYFRQHHTPGPMPITARGRDSDASLEWLERKEPTIGTFDCVYGVPRGRRLSGVAGVSIPIATRSGT